MMRWKIVCAIALLTGGSLFLANYAGVWKGRLQQVRVQQDRAGQTIRETLELREAARDKARKIFPTSSSTAEDANRFLFEPSPVGRYE